MAIQVSQVRVVILAGGQGTRVRHLLPDLPKPMAPACGRPFVEWVVRFLAKQGCRRFAVSTGYKAESIKRHFAASPVPGVEIACVAEPEPLGTAGGVRHVLRMLDAREEAFLVSNGDSLLVADLRPALAALEGACDGVIIGRPMADASRYGTLRLGDGGRLLEFEEKRPGAGVINSGLYVLTRRMIAAFPNRSPLSLEREVFPALVAAGYDFRVPVAEGPFLDIGTEADLKLADAFIAANKDSFL
jgi:D-glycero-alpha-D-manno-heptose 1-phosphate guanylyltransferase